MAMRSLSEVKKNLEKGAQKTGEGIKGLIKKAQEKISGPSYEIPVYGDEKLMS